MLPCPSLGSGTSQSSSRSGWSRMAVTPRSPLGPPKRTLERASGQGRLCVHAKLVRAVRFLRWVQEHALRTQHAGSSRGGEVRIGRGRTRFSQGWGAGGRARARTPAAAREAIRGACMEPSLSERSFRRMGAQNHMPGADGGGGIALGFSPSMPVMSSAGQSLSPEMGGDPEYANDSMMADM